MGHKTELLLGTGRGVLVSEPDYEAGRPGYR